MHVLLTLIFALQTDTIMFHAYLSRLEKHFPQAEKYIPERWLKSLDVNRSQSQETHPFVSMPFGYGPRTCLGRRFAQLELETLLAKVNVLAEKPLYFH